jgi:hypothetical protein
VLFPLLNTILEKCPQHMLRYQGKSFKNKVASHKTVAFYMKSEIVKNAPVSNSGEIDYEY